MSVAQIVRNFVNTVDDGTLFSYGDIQSEQKSVVAIELSRLNKQGIVKRLSKGKYYKPKQGYFGELPPSDSEVLDSLLSAPNSYITGVKAFNEMGLTTQVPSVITIATDKQPRRVKIKNLEIQFVSTKQEIAKADIYLVQLLDAVDSIRSIPDTSVEEVITYTQGFIKKRTSKEIKKLSNYALKYRPRTRALLGALLELQGYTKDAQILRDTLNPLSSYKVGVSEALLPNQRTWRIS